MPVGGDLSVAVVGERGVLLGLDNGISTGNTYIRCGDSGAGGGNCGVFFYRDGGFVAYEL